MFKKILVALDKSDISRYAFDEALSLAKSTGAELILLHVLNYGDPDSPDRLMLYSSSAQLNAKLIKQYEHAWNEYVTQYGSFLNTLEQDAKTAGVTVKYQQVYGNPGHSICDVAQNWNVDLITLGSHSRSGFQRLLLGSVSNYVMHHAPCSVLVIHQPSPASEKNSSDRLSKEVTHVS